MSKEAMKQALEALETYHGYMEPLTTVFGGPRVPAEQSTTGKVERAITSLRQALEDALAKQEQGEPVACVVPHGATMRLEWASVDAAHNAKIGPLYTTPPQRKPLTDEEIGAILEGVNAYGTRLYTFARAIEAAHGIKENT
jgi:hypothetical protein